MASVSWQFDAIFKFLCTNCDLWLYSTLSAFISINLTIIRQSNSRIRLQPPPLCPYFEHMPYFISIKPILQVPGPRQVTFSIAYAWLLCKNRWHHPQNTDYRSMQCCQRTTKQWPQATYTENVVQCGYVVFEIHNLRQTYRHTYHNTSHTYWRQRNNMFRSENCL